VLDGLLFSITSGASLARFEYWRILSTDIILFSALQIFHITEACKTFKLIPYVTANPAMPVEYKATSVSSDLFYEIELLNTCTLPLHQQKKPRKETSDQLDFLKKHGFGG